MTEQEIRVVDALVAVYCAPGAAHGADDPGLHWPRIAFSVRSGLYLWVYDGAGQCVGWGSWFRVDLETLEAIRTGDVDDWIRSGRLVDVVHGPHCVIADVVVVPGAPLETYRRVIDEIGARNQAADSLNGQLTKRNGLERWAVRINDGSPFWWRRCQSAWTAVLH